MKSKFGRAKLKLSHLLLNPQDDYAKSKGNFNRKYTSQQVTTYGFSLSTLHTEAIVQKQSVAFANVKEGFWNRTKKKNNIFVTPPPPSQNLLF